MDAGGYPQKLTEHEVQIVNEFCHLLEKSKQLFNGLRDLPQYGNKQWQAYFGRTFDVYTKLWKFQQQNRQVLDVKYDLKRWQIGEIASKIGQLYYHYYLRTSDTNYLAESFSFYSAIRSRAYYAKALHEDRPDLMVKKLRYYARFIVVCLLLRKIKLVRDLVRELAKHIDDYSTTYKPDDQMEWSLVLGEIKAFIDADNIVQIIDDDSQPVTVNHRLDADCTPPLDRTVTVGLQLEEVIIVGNAFEQIKFSELSLDMFRMLQTLERAPTEDGSQSLQLHDQSPAPGRYPVENGLGSSASNKRHNPHKYILYKPSFGQLFMFLSAASKELSADGILLLYISADGVFSDRKSSADVAWDFGGVAMNKRASDAADNSHRNVKTGPLKDTNCLYPGDLYSFLRKPTFLVIDSENSSAFINVPNLFGQPVVCLLSPEQIPPALQFLRRKGNLFTLFLHCPLTGFCTVCSIHEVPHQLWARCNAHVTRTLNEISRLFLRCRLVDHTYMQFFGDDFIRLLIVRFIFCCIVFRLHRAFKGRSYYPFCHPPLPEQELFQHPPLQKMVLDLAAFLDVRVLFLEPSDFGE